MKKPALYSSAHRPGRHGPPLAGDATAPTSRSRPGRASATADATTPPATAPVARDRRLRRFLQRNDRTLLFLAGLGIALAVVLLRDAGLPKRAALTQDDIDKAVLHTMENKTLPSRAAKAAELVIASVVRVEGYNGEENDEPGSSVQMQGVGSGVVIVDNGIILTNLHVVAGSKRMTVKFHEAASPKSTWCARIRKTTWRSSRPEGYPTIWSPRRWARPPICGPATRWLRSAFPLAWARRFRPA